MKTRLLGITLGLIAWISLVGAAPAHYHRQEFIIYDGTGTDFIIGAKVSVSWEPGENYPGGYQEDTTSAPHGNVQFRLPGELWTVPVTIEAKDYETTVWTVTLADRQHVGGQAFYLYVYPAAAAK